MRIGISRGNGAETKRGDGASQRENVVAADVPGSPRVWMNTGLPIDVRSRRQELARGIQKPNSLASGIMAFKRNPFKQ